MSINFRTQLCIWAIVSISYAADTSCFNLMNYVPPSFNYQLLELTPHFSINGQSLEKKESSFYDTDDSNGDLYDVDLYDHEDNTRNSTIGVEARHTYYGWIRRTEWMVSNFLVTDGNLGRANPNVTKNTNTSQSYSSYNDRSASASGHASVLVAHYFKWPFFIGAGINPALSGGINTDKKVSKTVSKYYYEIDADSARYSYRKNSSNKKNYSAGCGASLRIGSGHIDDASFAVAALNIIDIIKRNEKSYKGCNSKRTADLACLIEKSRKRRSFDSRIAFIENIDTLCSFIKKSGIADELSPRTILEIGDQWNHVFYQTRMKGFSIVLKPSAYLSQTVNKSKYSSYYCYKDVAWPYRFEADEDNDYKDNGSYPGDSQMREQTNHFDYTAEAMARYERPLSRFFQLSLISQVWVSRNQLSNEISCKPDEYTREYKYAQPVFSGMESASLGYYPNTRTAITVSESVNYYRKFDYFDIHMYGYDYQEIPGKNYDARQLTFSLDATIRYFISPQLQFRINGEINWEDSYSFSYSYPLWGSNNSGTTSSKRFNYGLSSNLIWSIF